MNGDSSPTFERLWKQAFERLSALDKQWNPAELAQTKQWMQASGIPRMDKLAELLHPGMTREQLWHVLVPVERQITRRKATDANILDTDLPADATPLPALDVTIIADNIRSALNVGGIFRTAECFGLKQIILTGYTSDPAADTRVAAAALGTEQRIPWRRCQHIRDAITELKQNGIPCIALETVQNAPPPETYSWPIPCALLLGSERFGLLPETIQTCAATIRIPMCGTKNSLNVVSALAVTAYQIRLHAARTT